MLEVEFVQPWKIGSATYAKGAVASLADDVARSLLVSQVVQWPQRRPVQGQRLADPFPQYVEASEFNDPNSAPRRALSATFASYKNLARNPDLIIAGTVTRDANGAAT